MTTIRLNELDARAFRNLEQALPAGHPSVDGKVRVWEQDLKRLLSVVRNDWYEQQAREASDGEETQQNMSRENGSHLAYYGLPDVVTDDAREIVGALLPEFLTLFLRKNAKYRDVVPLGARGVFPDVNRKLGVLKSVVWDGEPEVEGAEPTAEVISDMIGHLFLMWRLLNSEQQMFEALQAAVASEPSASYQTPSAELARAALNRLWASSPGSASDVEVVRSYLGSTSIGAFLNGR